MKINIQQLNPKSLGFEKNKELILSKIKESNNDVLNVFPELAISGMPLMSAIEYEDTYINSALLCEEICQTNKDIILGTPIKIEDNRFNSIVFFSKGEVIGLSTKKNLGDFDIGFDSGSGIETIVYNGKSIGFGFEEDLEEFALLGNRVDILIICSNIVFELDYQQPLYSKLIPMVRKIDTTLIYVNRFGSEGGYLFAGESFVINKRGEICSMLPLFEDSSSQIETDNLKLQYQNPLPRMERLYMALVFALREYFSKNGIKKAVLGLSGGIDSALVVVIAASALGKENVVGVLMPSEFSSEHSIEDALCSAKNLGIEHHIVPIKNSFDVMSEELMTHLPSSFDLAEENLQSRLRCVTLMWFANKLSAALLNTTNKSEAAVGYGTLYGDTSGAISVLGDVYKTEVWELAKWINRNNELIPYNSIHKAPSAELRPGQKDSDSLPDYDILDSILLEHLENRKGLEEIILETGHPREIVEKVLRLVRINEWKRRQCPTAVKVTKYCFGLDRKYPIS